MSFNPDPRKQVQQVIFSCKSRRSTHAPLAFNNNNVSQSFSQKHLGVLLDFKLTFEDHINDLLFKVNKAVDLMRKPRNLLPRATLIQSYIQSFHLARSRLW